MAFTMRFSDEVDVEELDKIARLHGLKRTEFLNTLILQAIQQGFVPRFDGEGVRAFGSQGGVVSLRQVDNAIECDVDDSLTKNETAAMKKAVSLASRKLWVAAKQQLMDAGFIVYEITL